MAGPLHRLADGFEALARSPRAAAVALVLACAVAYAGSPFNGFVLDDHQGVLGNPLVMEDGRALEAFVRPWQVESRADRLYRPLTTVTLALQRALHGPVPAGFHLGNVLLHAAATLLAFAAARALLPGQALAALLGGLLFAVHPLHTDAVSSVVNRSEVLAAAFALAGFLAWRRWLAGGGGALLAATGLLFLLSLLSKESGAPLLAFAAAWALPSAHRARRGPAVAAGWAAAFLLPLAAYGLLRVNALEGDLLARSNRYFAGVDAATTFLTMAGVMARHVALWVLPWPLSPDYSYESIPLSTSPLDPWPLAGLLGLPALAALCVFLLSRPAPRARGAGFGLLWAALFLAPATNLVPLLIPMAERMGYAATAGAFLALGAAGARAFEARRGAAALACAVLLAAAAAGTLHREQAWRDDVTLAADTVSKHPRNALMWANLGAALADRGQAPAAVAALWKALEIAPRKWEFRRALARLLHDSGLHRDEADLLRHGLDLGPRAPDDVAWACRAREEAEPGTGGPACLQSLSGAAPSGAPPTP